MARPPVIDDLRSRRVGHGTSRGGRPRTRTTEARRFLPPSGPGTRRTLAAALTGRSSGDARPLPDSGARPLGAGASAVPAAAFTASSTRTATRR
jgi:hypothetical protein